MEITPFDWRSSGRNAFAVRAVPKTFTSKTLSMSSIGVHSKGPHVTMPALATTPQSTAEKKLEFAPFSFFWLKSGFPIRAIVWTRAYVVFNGSHPPENFPTLFRKATQNTLTPSQPCSTVAVHKTIAREKLTKLIRDN